MAHDRRRVARMASIQGSPFQQFDEQLCERRLHEWARDLGVPKPVVHSFEQDDRRIEAVGVRVSRSLHAPGRVFFLLDDGTMMLAWGIRIKEADRRAFAEARFSPQGDMTSSVQDYDPADRAGNARALADLDLLFPWKHPGGAKVKCRDPILAILRTYKGIEPPSRYELAWHVYSRAETPAQASDALRKCLERIQNRTGETWADLLRQAGWDPSGR
jgi:hypothetical protein